MVKGQGTFYWRVKESTCSKAIIMHMQNCPTDHSEQFTVWVSLSLVVLTTDLVYGMHGVLSLLFRARFRARFRIAYGCVSFSIFESRALQGGFDGVLTRWGLGRWGKLWTTFNLAISCFVIEVFSSVGHNWGLLGFPGVCRVWDNHIGIKSSAHTTRFV